MTLDLAYTNLDDEGIPSLIALGKEVRFQDLDIDGTTITDEGKQELKKALPWVQW